MLIRFNPSLKPAPGIFVGRLPEGEGGAEFWFSVEFKEEKVALSGQHDVPVMTPKGGPFWLPLYVAPPGVDVGEAQPYVIAHGQTCAFQGRVVEWFGPVLLPSALPSIWEDEPGDGPGWVLAAHPTQGVRCFQQGVQLVDAAFGIAWSEHAVRQAMPGVKWLPLRRA